MRDDHQTTILQLQSDWDSQKQAFEVEKQKLVEDHQESLAKFQEMIDKERDDIASKHAEEITSLKDEIANVKTSYDEKLAQAATTLEETIEAHKIALDTLTKEKDAVIASTEGSKAAREKELQEDITNITAARTKAQQQMMVPFPRARDPRKLSSSKLEMLTSRTHRRKQMHLRNNSRQNWRFVPRGLGLL